MNITLSILAIIALSFVAYGAWLGYNASMDSEAGVDSVGYVIIGLAVLAFTILFKALHCLAVYVF